jgi:hypothetical protein
MNRTLGYLVQIAGTVIVLVALVVWFFFDQQDLGLVTAEPAAVEGAGQASNLLLVCIMAAVGVILFIIGGRFKKQR